VLIVFYLWHTATGCTHQLLKKINFLRHFSGHILTDLVHSTTICSTLQRYGLKGRIWDYKNKQHNHILKINSSRLTQKVKNYQPDGSRNNLWGCCQSQQYFSECFHYYFIPTICFGPYGPSSGSGYEIVIKTFRKILLRLTAPPKIICNRCNRMQP
jgi:hypothetical protein